MQPIILPVAQFMMVDDVPKAMEMGLLIEEPREREPLLKQGAMRWARFDWAGVEKYLAANDVSEAVNRAARAAKKLGGRRITPDDEQVAEEQ